MDGGSLRGAVDDGLVMHEVNLAVVAYSMASALKYLHDRCVLHRDVKLENILLTRNGKVRLADFGIGKLVYTGLCINGICLFVSYSCLLIHTHTGSKRSV